MTSECNTCNDHGRVPVHYGPDGATIDCPACDREPIYGPVLTSKEVTEFVVAVHQLRYELRRLVNGLVAPFTADEPPRAPMNRRPGDVPYYIDPDCPECGTALEPEAEAFYRGWYDEFICPTCDDGLHMDWPDEYNQWLLNRVEDETFMTLDELWEQLDEDDDE